MDASLEVDASRFLTGRLWWAILAVLAAVLVAGGVSLFRSTPGGEVRTPAPSFVLPSLEGNTKVRLDQFRGRLLVINFWASWCVPCREEAPLFARAARQDRGVSFLGIDVLDGREEAMAFVKEFELPYTQAVDHRGVVLHRYRVTGAPETFFVDRRGQIVGHFIGAFHGDQLRDALKRFKELPPDGVLEFEGRGRQLPVG